MLRAEGCIEIFYADRNGLRHFLLHCDLVLSLLLHGLKLQKYTAAADSGVLALERDHATQPNCHNSLGYDPGSVGSAAYDKEVKTENGSPHPQMHCQPIGTRCAGRKPLQQAQQRAQQ